MYNTIIQILREKKFLKQAKTGNFLTLIFESDLKNAVLGNNLNS